MKRACYSGATLAISSVYNVNNSTSSYDSQGTLVCCVWCTFRFHSSPIYQWGKRPERLTMQYSWGETQLGPTPLGLTQLRVSSSRKPLTPTPHAPLRHLCCILGPALHLPLLLDHKSRLGTSSCTPSPSPKQCLDKSFHYEPNAKPHPFLCGQALPSLCRCVVLWLIRIGTWA